MTSSMSLPLVYFFFLLIFCPMKCFPCPHHFTCGHTNIDLFYPFYVDIGEPNCTGKYLIRCDNGSIPVIKLDKREHILIDILSAEKVLIVQDPDLSGYLFSGQCGFLYNFTHPIHNFLLPVQSPVLNNRPGGCRYNIDIIHQTFFDPYSCRLCKDYSVYYWDDSDESTDHLEKAHHPGCLAAQPPLFRWVLSFDNYNDGDGLYLLSAGFSHHFELRVDCFECHVNGRPCSSSDDSEASSSCSCDNVCEPKGTSSPKSLIFRLKVLNVLHCSCSYGALLI